MADNTVFLQTNQVNNSLDSDDDFGSEIKGKTSVIVNTTVLLIDYQGYAQISEIMVCTVW